jgi:hypothetical protein
VKEEIIFELDFKSQIALLGMSQILCTRMQCIDYPFRNKMFAGFKDMVRRDGIWMLAKGLTPVLLG